VIMTDEQIATLAQLVADRLRVEPYLSKRALADHLGCSVRSIELAVNAGMPAYTVFGRPKFKLSEVEPWLVAHRHLSVAHSPGHASGAASAATDPPPDTRS